METSVSLTRSQLYSGCRKASKLLEEIQIKSLFLDMVPVQPVPASWCFRLWCKFKRKTNVSPFQLCWLFPSCSCSSSIASPVFHISYLFLSSSLFYPSPTYVFLLLQCFVTHIFNRNQNSLLWRFSTELLSTYWLTSRTYRERVSLLLVRGWL